MIFAGEEGLKANSTLALTNQVLPPVEMLPTKQSLMERDAAEKAEATETKTQAGEAQAKRRRPSVN